MFEWSFGKSYLQKHLEKTHLQDMKIGRMKMTAAELALNPITYRKELDKVDYTNKELEALQILAKKFGFDMAKDLKEGDTIMLNLQLIIHSKDSLPISNDAIDAMVGDGDFKR